MRDVKEIREDIVELSKMIEPEVWQTLKELLDEAFVAYFMEARKEDIDLLLEDIDHYERQQKKSKSLRTIIEDFRQIVEQSTSSEAKTVYKFKEMIKKE